MCVVSAVSGEYQFNYPNPITFPYQDWEQYKERMRKAIAQDIEEGNPDCEDPEKARWMKELEERMVNKYGLKPLVAK